MNLQRPQSSSLRRRGAGRPAAASALVALTLSAVTLAGAQTGAQAAEPLLAPTGDVVRLRLGDFATVFGDRTGGLPHLRYLAAEVMAPDGTVQVRGLGTSFGMPSWHTWGYDPHSKRVFAAWFDERRGRLAVALLDANAEIETFALNVPGVSGAPMAELTRGALDGGDGGILHLAWNAEAGPIYLPIALRPSGFVAAELIDLAQIFAEDGDVSWQAAKLVGFSSGSRASTVQLVFRELDVDEVATVELGIAPLSWFADDGGGGRPQIVGFGTSAGCAGCSVSILAGSRLATPGEALAVELKELSAGDSTPGWGALVADWKARWSVPNSVPNRAQFLVDRSGERLLGHWTLRGGSELGWIETEHSGDWSPARSLPFDRVGDTELDAFLSRRLHGR